MRTLGMAMVLGTLFVAVIGGAPGSRSTDLTLETRAYASLLTDDAPIYANSSELFPAVCCVNHGLCSVYPGTKCPTGSTQVACPCPPAQEAVDQ